MAAGCLICGGREAYQAALAVGIVRGMEAAARPRRVLPRLLSESAIYGFGGVANQALTIFLVPIYARVLGADGYGVVAVVNATLSLSTMLATLALPQAFFRAYLRDADTDQDRRHALAVASALRIAVSSGFLLVFALASVPLTLVLFGGSTDELPIIALIGPIVFFDTLNLIPLSFLRAERRPGTYAAISFTRAILGSILIIAFVVVLDLGVLGVVLGSASSAVVSATIGVIALQRTRPIRFRWDTALVRRMLAFSLPLVPAAVAGWGLNLSDRYIVRAYDGFEAAGIYSSGYTAGLVISAIAVAPFTLAWGAAYWEIHRGPEPMPVFVRVLTVYTIVASGLALALSAVGTDAIRILLGAEFEAGRFVVPFSAFGGVLYGAYSILTTGLNLASQTRWVPVTMIGAAITSVALNLALVPAIGFMGAAISTLLSYALLAVSSAAVSQHYYPVAWDYPRVLGALLIGLALAGVALGGPDHAGFRIAVVLAYPVLVIVTRILHPDDVAAARRLVGSRLARR